MTAPARIGLRRPHISSREAFPTGRASIGLPDSHLFRSSDQCVSARVAARRVFLETFQTDHVQITRNSTVEFMRRVRPSRSHTWSSMSSTVAPPNGAGQ